MIVVLFLTISGLLYFQQLRSGTGELNKISPAQTPSPVPSSSLSETAGPAASQPVAVSEQRAAPTPEGQTLPLCIRYEESKSALDGNITIALGAISYEGLPLRHFVSFTVNSPGHKSVRYSRKENGDKIVFRGGGTFEIIIVSIDAVTACFDARKLD